MALIAPSILSADFCDLKSAINSVSAADWLHLDVMDGHFVPNLTIGVPVVASVRRHTAMLLDVHLMIETPVRYVDAFARAGADLLCVHLEADTPGGISDALSAIRRNGLRRGVALRPGTPAQALFPYLDGGLELALVMTVEPGFGGQSFMADQLAKVALLRDYIDRHCPGCLLEVDGGVNPQTAPLCLEAGADVLVAGSAVFGAADIPAAISQLRGDTHVQ